jgi:GABA(A) receptor-associated protein
MNTDSKHILDKYPNKIPIIIKFQENSKLKLDKYKYLVPNDFTMSSFQLYIRNKIEIKPEKAIFIMVNNKMTTQSMLLSQVYNMYKNPDGFLYLTIAEESLFGQV